MKNLFASGGQGGSFRENRPVNHLDPPQKLLIKGGYGLQLKRIYATHDRLWFFYGIYFICLLKLTVPVLFFVFSGKWVHKNST